MNKPILDPCCGSRMMHFNRQNPSVLYGDQRTASITVTDRSKGNASGTRTIKIEPDCTLDFRALPFADSSFDLVAFDPPHLLHAGPKSWLGAKYGTLNASTWQEDLRKGFAECWRVLSPRGTLVFKWAETQIKLSQILALTPHQPVFGHTSGKRAGTHWMVFYKAAQ